MQLDGTGTKTKVVLTAVGDGDLNQLSSLFVADQIQIAVFKANAVELAGGNKRPTIVFVKYMGSAINRMKRAQCQPVLASLREYYSGHHVDMEITSADELTAEVVEKKLRSCGGAFAPDSYESGAGVSRSSTGSWLAQLPRSLSAVEKRCTARASKGRWVAMETWDLQQMQR